MAESDSHIQDHHSVGTARSEAGNADGRRSLGMDISREMVSLMKDYLGRGPTNARTYIRDNLIVVIMRDTMTKAESTLADRGEQDAVRTTRRLFQETMREDASAVVERLTGRKVVSFMSDHDIGKDVAAEIFVLDPDHDDRDSPTAPGD
jgi:uncharacterized protein YbcI